MPSSTYLHKRDGVSLKRMTRTAASQAWAIYSHQLRAVGDDDALGITWDGDPATGMGGRCLWVGTESSHAAGTTPGLLQIPIEGCNGTALSPARVFQCPGISVGCWIKDLAWNGEGFFALIGDTGGLDWLIKMDGNGRNVKQLNTSITNTARALCFDGEKLYLTWTVAGGLFGVLGVYDPRTGQLRDSYLMGLPNSPGAQAPGVAWNGCHLALKVVRNPIDFMLCDTATLSPYGVVQPVSLEQTGTPQPAVDYEQAPLAWDGAFYWSLSSEDVLGGG